MEEEAILPTSHFDWGCDEKPTVAFSALADHPSSYQGQSYLYVCIVPNGTIPILDSWTIHLAEVPAIQERHKLLRPAHPVFDILLGDTGLSQLLFKPDQCILQFSS
jgi:hypothetical protein